jgi:hypothetical protein
LKLSPILLVIALLGCETKREPADSLSSSFAASSSPSVIHSAGSQKSLCGNEVIRDEGIGELRIGATVESIRQKCNVLRDTTAMSVEGMPARRLSVALSRDTVEAEIVDGRVWRIAVRSRRLRTADSLGVGTSIERLRQLKNPRLMTGEGGLFVATPDHCGMSFRLANTGPDALRGNRDRAGLSRLPPSTVVSEVLVFGCR